MARVKNIYEKQDVLKYLISRNLLKQYKKSKKYLLDGNVLQTKFKERNPKGSGIWYFRISKKYRALGVFSKDRNLIIFKIDDHQ